MEKNRFQEAVLEWYNENGRSFYWREENLTPFQVLILEMMLKRTRAETVDKFVAEILEQFSSPQKVVDMEPEDITEVIEPLGLYNRRCKNLVNVCRDIVEKYDGEIPDEREDLLSISGVGEYIADAVLCFGFGKSVLVLDGNVAQVASYYFDLPVPDDLRQDSEIRDKLQPYVPEQRPEEFNWGLIDNGALLKKGNYDPLGLRSS